MRHRMFITNLNTEQAAVLCRAIDHFVAQVYAWLERYEGQTETHKIPPQAAFDHEHRIVA